MRVVVRRPFPECAGPRPCSRTELSPFSSPPILTTREGDAARAAPRGPRSRPLSCSGLRILLLLGFLQARLVLGVRETSPTVHVSPACLPPPTSPGVPVFTTARKRSYKRALRRAAQHPEQRTQYRGRPCTLRQLRSSYVGLRAGAEVQPRTKPPVLIRRPDRLLVWSWNAGGITTDLWQELLLTLEQLPVLQRPQVVMLQESHWTEAITPNFHTSAWTVLTSPTTDCKAAGLVMLIDKQVHHRGTLTYADPLPGRIQHARVATAHWTVDLLNVYQKPQSTQKGQAQTSRDLRKQVWQTLRQQLSRLPERHTLILGGDHNCHLRPSACAGPQAGSNHSNSMPDQHILQKLLEDLRLLQVNSWTRKAGPTYIHPTGSSQIDHLIGRQSQVDNLAKQACPIKVALAAWRQGGRHLPVAGTFKLLNFQSLNRSAPPARSWDHPGPKMPDLVGSTGCAPSCPSRGQPTPGTDSGGTGPYAG